MQQYLHVAYLYWYSGLSSNSTLFSLPTGIFIFISLWRCALCWKLGGSAIDYSAFRLHTEHRSRQKLHAKLASCSTDNALLTWSGRSGCPSSCHCPPWWHIRSVTRNSLFPVKTTSCTVLSAALGYSKVMYWFSFCRLIVNKWRVWPED